MNKIKSVLTTLVSVGFVLVFMIWGIAEPDKLESLSERRLLARLPGITLESISDTSFMTGFEKYMLDHFPLRDKFRSLKAYAVNNVFFQRDNNGLYTAGEHISKLDFPESVSDAEYAAKRFSAVCEKYFTQLNANIYLSVIPDKNYFLAEENGYPNMNAERLTKTLESNFAEAKYIDIFDTLSADDFYFTDSHWRQERLADTASTLLHAMGTDVQAEYEKKDAGTSFYGVYYGQAALSHKPEKLYYLTNDVISEMKAYDFETDKAIPIYDLDAARGRDPYEMFLGGAKSIITVENPNAENERELVVFRDSFGSSIAPLLAQGYSKVVLIDIRYISVANIGKAVEFSPECDVLFLYSTSVINHSETIK